MQIQQSQVVSSSQYQFKSERSSVIAQVREGRLVEDGNDPGNVRQLTVAAAKESVAASLASYRVAATPIAPQDDLLPDDDQLTGELALMKALVEAISQREIQIAVFAPASGSAAMATPATAAGTSAAAPVPETTTFNLSLYSEYEYSSVDIAASLTDADGNQLDLALSVVMERRYEETAFSVLRQQGVLTDPLVLNFSGNAQLGTATVNFDLDSDGNAEALPSLISNSAYLALDRDASGVIENGLELFGVQSGNGFAELAGFDEDGNGFIDSGDSVYQNLLLFRPENGSTVKLADAGVDALYLNAVDSPFRLTDSNNNTLGQVRATSFYVANSNVGSLQQIDLAV